MLSSNDHDMMAYLYFDEVVYLVLLLMLSYSSHNFIGLVLMDYPEQ